MAYQPKSYRKFVATAATATLVATAVTPAFAAETGAATDFTDVPERYLTAVNYLLENQITNGITDTQYGTVQSIKRVDAAVMIAKALKLDLSDRPASGFADVPDRAAVYVNALKDEGIINGKTTTSFGAADNITRGEIALILANAYNLSGDADVKFTDVSPRYAEAVEALVANKVTEGKTPTQFGTADAITRGEFAIFLFRIGQIDPVKPDPVTNAAISSVTAINETQIEVTFKNALTDEQVDFIEEAGNRIVVFDSSETAKTANLVSTVVSFSDDNKTATVVLADNESTDEEETELVEGRAYTVALVSEYGDDTALATVEAQSASTVLLKGLEVPGVELAGDEDTFVFNFDEEMTEEALNEANYTVYDKNNAEVEGVFANGEFVDATSNDAVEFDITPGVLEAGQTYKVVIDQAVEAKDGSQLSTAQRTVTLKTPTLSEAKPKVSVARVTSDATIVVTFDKEIAELQDLNLNQFSVTQADGREFNVNAVELAENGRDVVLTVDPLVVDGAEQYLRDGRTYKVSLPAGLAVNETFTNATSDAVNDKSVVAANNTEVTDFSAKFVRQTGENDAADLLITLNAPANVTDTAGITIENLDGSFSLVDPASIEVYEGDSTGKTFIVRDVETAFDGFVPEAGDTYEITLAEGSFDSITTTATPNTNEELDITLNGLDISAPEVDSVTAVSADKVTVEFDEAINVSNLEESDIEVQGFIKSVTGEVAPATLTGSNLIKVSGSGDTLTITPASDAVKFETGQDLTVVIAEDSLTDVNGIENGAFDSATDLDPSDFNDEAAPVIIGTEITGTDAMTVTYSEEVRFEGGTAENAGAQYTVSGALRSGAATTATASGNEVALTFGEEIFEAGKVYANATLTYRSNTTSALEDLEDIRQASQTVKGLLNVVVAP